MKGFHSHSNDSFTGKMQTNQFLQANKRFDFKINVKATL